MHLSLEMALDLAEGRISEDQAIFWEKHLETCVECAQDVSGWQQFKFDLGRSHLTNASDEDLRNAFAIFPTERTERFGSKTLRSVFGTIIFDNFAQPALEGARGASITARQLVMRAEEFDIHVKIWGDPDRREMLGQLLPRSSQEFIRVARFHLLRNGERLDTTTINDLGEFHFTDIPEGDLSLQIDLPNVTVIGALNVIP